MMNTQEELQVAQCRELQDNELDEVSGGFWREYVDFMTDFALFATCPLFGPL
jgi:hypothetical protein